MLLVSFTDVFERLANPVEIADPPANLIELRRMQRDLAVLAAPIVDVEDPLKVAFAGSASGAVDRGRMEGMTLQE